MIFKKKKQIIKKHKITFYHQKQIKKKYSQTKICIKQKTVCKQKEKGTNLQRRL